MSTMCKTHPASSEGVFQPPRRDFLRRAGMVPLLAGPLPALLAGCGKDDGWPEGMAPIRWDRDTCIRCKMVISDQRFAAELRGGADRAAFKFDDLGCLLFWLREAADRYPWMSEAATRMWVADFASPGRGQMNWLDPRQAHYVVRTSPMGYNFAAVAVAQGDAIRFDEMQRQTLAKGK